MTEPMIISFTIAAGVFLWGIVAYNLLVRDRNRVAQSWSDVGVQLARRHDLIPKLVEVVKQHAGYEQTVFENVAMLRARGMSETSPAALGAVEGALGAGLQRLIALAEAYPELKASASYLELMKNLTDAENQIQFARRYYNGAVNNLNTRIATFPDMLPARLFAFRPAEYFEFDSAPAAAPW
ncbi:MAG TPA: LemA family protein [Steroidobacteraceae bacterium]